MNIIKCIVVLIFLTACNNKHGATNDIQKKDAVDIETEHDTIVKRDTIYYNQRDWQQDFGLTHDPEIDSIWGKPVKFYIENPDCSPIAIDFYTGEFQPTDNRTTAALLALATTNEAQLRPFYRWCLNKTIQIQDGALAEYTGVPARQYAEKFPKEFFEYMDADTSNKRYDEWVMSISYSGFYDKEDIEKPDKIRSDMKQLMNRNCSNCTELLQRRIDKFSKDCFH